MKKLLRNAIICIMKAAGPLMFMILAVYIVMGMGFSVIVNWGGATP